MHGVNIKLKLLCLLFGVALPSHVTGRKFTSSQFFLVYWKTENISLYFYFPAYFSKLSFVWLATTGDSTVLMSQKTDFLGSWVFQSQTTAHALSQHWRTRDGLMWCWHFLRRVWFYCEVNRMNSDKYKKKHNKTNVFSRNRHLTLSSSKATGRDWEALCDGLTPGHTALTWAVPWCDGFWGCHVRTCHRFKPVSGCSSYFSNKLGYFTLII